MPSCFCLWDTTRSFIFFSVQIAYQLVQDYGIPLGRSSPTARRFYVCHFQGNYKENERVGQSSQLRPAIFHF
jgi:hypothetical protein